MGYVSFREGTGYSSSDGKLPSVFRGCKKPGNTDALKVVAQVRFEKKTSYFPVYWLVKNGILVLFMK